jgi:hypothetical protein
MTEEFRTDLSDLYRKIGEHVSGHVIALDSRSLALGIHESGWNGTVPVA